jgi:hypothetical protein
MPGHLAPAARQRGKRSSQWVRSYLRRDQGEKDLGPLVVRICLQHSLETLAGGRKVVPVEGESSGVDLRP